MNTTVQEISLLHSALHEIRGLRSRLAEVEPKAQAYDVLATIVGLIPRPTQGYGMDVAWQIEHFLKSQTEEASEAQQAG